jgi:hypothetical protein
MKILFLEIIYDTCSFSPVFCHFNHFKQALMAVAQTKYFIAHCVLSSLRICLPLSNRGQEPLYRVFMEIHSHYQNKGLKTEQTGVLFNVIVLAGNAHNSGDSIRCLRGFRLRISIITG